MAVGVNYVARPWESGLFRRCRRAWDFAARERRDYEPIEPAQVFSFGEAIHDALDVYYFPGMWDWNRVIVRPLTLAGFKKSMRRQRDTYTRTRELSAEQVQDWEQHLELGTGLLRRYFDWAQEVDRFTPIGVRSQFDISLPDPADPDSGLITPEGRPLQYRVRIDLAVIDDHELYWLVEHRIVTGLQWPEIDELRLDQQALTRSWAWQLAFLAKVEGTIYNEIRLTEPSSDKPTVKVRAMPGPGGITTQRGTESFRRTQLPRTELEITRHGMGIALEMQDMTDPSVRIYPNASWENCSRCAYRQPCLAITQGVDETAILEGSYRTRTSEDFEPGRLGSVWGFVPDIYRVAEHRVPGAEQ
ncbi:MAG TPA: PD-(D/E)XK nuclease family protein [Pseudonocardiaceae bacterium]|nr:PD-(D/E)XK nuclease family protein [Pseudonocardiaceae bacterium]